MKKRHQYAISQHDLCCEYLDIGNSHKDRCNTLYETLLDLQDDLAKSKERNASLEILASELIIALFRIKSMCSTFNLKDVDLEAQLAVCLEQLQQLKLKK